MKWIGWAWNTLLVAIVLSLSLSLHQVRADSWSEGDKWRQVAYTALHVADWKQTHVIADHPYWGDINPVLGAKPSSGEIDKYFAATLVAHYVIVDQLPSKWRRRFQYFTIGFQATAVGWNYSTGVRVRF